jgi:hypothetical protein
VFKKGLATQKNPKSPKYLSIQLMNQIPVMVGCARACAVSSAVCPGQSLLVAAQRLSLRNPPPTHSHGCRWTRRPSPATALLATAATASTAVPTS